jgi:hypothetical protein
VAVGPVAGGRGTVPIVGSGGGAVAAVGAVGGGAGPSFFSHDAHAAHTKTAAVQSPAMGRDHRARPPTVDPAGAARRGITRRR